MSGVQLNPGLAVGSLFTSRSPAPASLCSRALPCGRLTRARTAVWVRSSSLDLAAMARDLQDGRIRRPNSQRSSRVQTVIMQSKDTGRYTSGVGAESVRPYSLPIWLANRLKRDRNLRKSNCCTNCGLRRRRLIELSSERDPDVFPAAVEGSGVTL
jgi:hypothetical protein